MDSKLQTLKACLNEAHDLEMVGDLLEWDQLTYMPSGGGEARAEHTATVKRLAHEKFTSDEIGQLLDDLAADGAVGDYDSDDASLVRVARWKYNRKRKLPTALVAEIARHQSAAQEIWIKARAENDFALFRPALEKMFDLKRQEAEALGPSDSIYDPLLDEYERGMKTAQVKAVFDALRAEIVPLVKAVSANADAVSNAVLHQSFDAAKQREFGMMVIEKFGFDFERGRLDVAVHPFETSFSPGDVRLTTRYEPDFLNTALFGTMHEAGHGMYEQGVSPALQRTLLCAGASLGIHESQSRLWENLVGRSRGFWKYFYPHLQTAFPQLAATNLETFYRAINKVSPSFIRIEADELTYSLHIMLRFELEQEVLEGKVRVADLPAAWNARMEDYLGISPPNDRLGVLQDTHWSAGLIGYFPTYALGTIVSVQLFNKAVADAPDVPAQMERGEFSSLLGWLRENVYRHGKKFAPAELVKRITGGPLDSRPYVNYLKTKFGEIYGL
jgi:carboxypeptidase Taq